MLAQSPITVNEVDGRTLMVKGSTHSTYEWQNGEPVFTDTDAVNIWSVNHENVFQQVRVVLPLEEAVALAKAILAMQEDAALDAHIEEMARRHEDHLALMDDALAHEVVF